MESSEHCCLAWIQLPLPAGILKLELPETTCLQVGLYQLLGWQLKYVFNVHQDPLGFHDPKLTHGGRFNQPNRINPIGSVNSRPSSWEMLHFLARKIEKLTVKKSPPISESLPIHVQQIRHSDHSGYDSGNVGLCGALVSIISLQTNVVVS